MKNSLCIILAEVVLLAMASCQQPSEEDLLLEVVSVPDTIGVGNDFELAIRTAPHASSRLDIPLIRIDFTGTEVDSQSYELHKYSTANSDGIAYWVVSADEISSRYPFSLLVNPQSIPGGDNDSGYGYVSITVVSAHPDYAERAEMALRVRYEPTVRLLT